MRKAEDASPHKQRQRQRRRAQYAAHLSSFHQQPPQATTGSKQHRKQGAVAVAVAEGVVVGVGTAAAAAAVWCVHVWLRGFTLMDTDNHDHHDHHRHDPQKFFFKKY